MAVAAVVILSLGVQFFLSGLVVNIIQAICFVLIRPLSKNTYRRINRVVAELLWLELIWLLDWWGGVQIELFTDTEDFQLMGKEHALLICNHRSDIDWLLLLVGESQRLVQQSSPTFDPFLATINTTFPEEILSSVMEI